MQGNTKVISLAEKMCLAVHIVLSLFLCVVESLPSGAPLQACDTLSPALEGHTAPTQMSPVPYIIDLSPFADDHGGYYYLPGETYTCKWQ